MPRTFSSRFDVSQIFGIDPRSLALFRVALALVLLSDLAARTRDIDAFYTDSGVLPRVAALEVTAGLAGLFSLHLFNGTAAAQWLLFAVAFVAALALGVGYRTKTATLVSWILLVSLHNRNPFVLQGGDVLLRMMLFWSLFLPLHARASLDRWLAQAAPATPPASLHSLPDRPWVSTGTLAAILQVCFVYWFTTAFKTDASWRSEGTAVGYALSIDQLARPLGHALLAYPALMRLLTFGTVALEAFGPCLALLPFWRLRLLMVVVFSGFHFIMGLCLTLGIFTWIAPTAWLLFVPSEAWNWLGARAPQWKISAPMLALVSTTRARVQRIARALGALGASGAPSARSGWTLPASQALTKRVRKWRLWATQGAGAFFLVYVFAWNLRAVNFATYERAFPQRWNWIGDSMRLDQVWDMFSPFPFKEDGWFLAPAHLDDGTRVNLMRPDAPLSFQRPANLSSTFADAMWQKYLLNLWSLSNAAQRPNYVAYLVREWNAQHDPSKRVQSVELVYMQQNNLPGLRKDKIKKNVVWQQNG